MSSKLNKHFNYDVLKLIQHVEARPCLWDKNLEINKDKVERKTAWEEICNELEEGFNEMSWEERHTTGEIIQNKWTNIRDAFVRSLKLKSKTQRPYVYHKELKFLKKIILNDEDQDSTEAVEPVAVLKQEPRKSPTRKETGNISRKSRRINDYEDSIPTSLPKKSRRTRKTSNDSDYVTFERTDVSNDLDFVDTSDNNNGRLMNEDEAFFASLLPSVVRYNEDERLEFRIEVLAVMKKIKDKRRGEHYSI